MNKDKQKELTLKENVMDAYADFLKVFDMYLEQDNTAKRKFTEMRLELGKIFLDFYFDERK